VYILSTLEFKHIGALGIMCFLFWLFKVRKPTFYGGVFCLLCVYIPLSSKIPLNLFPGINGLNIFYCILLTTLVKAGKKAPCHSDSVKRSWLLWCMVCGFSVVVAYLCNDTIYGSPIHVCKRWMDPFFIYLFAKRLVSDEDRMAALDGVVMGTILFSMHLLIQGIDIGDKVRVGGMFDDPNAAAAFIAAYASVLFSLFINTRRKILSLICLILVFVAYFAELQTVSRGGIIGFGVGLLVTSYVTSLNFKLLIAFIITLMLVFSPSFLPEKVALRFSGQDMHGLESNEADVSFTTRIEIWHAAVRMSIFNPLGVGMDSFKERVGEYGGPALRDAHNVYLLVAAETGLLGIVLFVKLILHLLKRGLAAQKNKEDVISKIAGQALLGSLAALIFTNFFSVTMRDMRVFGYIGVLAAIIKILPTNLPIKRKMFNRGGS